MKGKLKDLLGQRFGRLIVIELADKRTTGRAVWRCKCDCGSIKEIVGTSLTSGNTKSCGCYNKEIASKQAKLHVKPKGQSSRNYLYSNYRSTAKRRNLEFSLSTEEFETLTKGNCYYCDNPPSQIINQMNLNGNYIYNGIDRIDSSKGYTLDNCVPCCKTCNTAKLIMTQTEFFRWVTKVYNHINSKASYLTGAYFEKTTYRND